MTTESDCFPFFFFWGVSLKWSYHALKGEGQAKGVSCEFLNHLNIRSVFIESFWDSSMNENKFLNCRLVRQYICDDRAEQVRTESQTSLWDFLDEILMPGLLSRVSWDLQQQCHQSNWASICGQQVLGSRKAMIQKENSFSDTIVVRSKTEPVGWSDAEAFFWKEEACFPGRHTR